ncbi:hypothetical protein ACQKFJ_27510, partial [Bacillus mycoides]
SASFSPYVFYKHYRVSGNDLYMMIFYSGLIYTVKRPHLKAVMLGLGANLQPGLHHPYMKFDHSCIMDGVEILKQTVLKVLEDRG